MAGRYVTLAVMLPIAIYFVCLLYLPPTVGRWAQGLLCCAFVLLLWQNSVAGLDYARNLHAYVEPFAEELKAGVPRSILAERFSHPPNRIYTNQEHLGTYLDMLHSAGMGMFRSLRLDPIWQVVTLESKDVEMKDSNHYVLREPRFVYAVRIHYQYQPIAPSAWLRFSWQASAGTKSFRREVDMRIPLKPQADSVLVWINGPLYEFTIYPDDKPYECTIGPIELVQK
jgi:hypothetical protein